MDKQELEQERDQLVVKDNDMIRKARYRLTTNEQKFLCYIISKIKPTDMEVPELEIRVVDFCCVCGINPAYFYTEFKEMFEDFYRKEFWIETEDEVFRWIWFSDITYHVGHGVVSVTLSKRLNQYLIGLRQNFTMYGLYNILALRSKYAIRLFELFESYAYQHKKKFDIDALKDLLCATNYTNYKDFRRRVLEPALKEINIYTELEVTVEEERTGKKVTSIIFCIEVKSVAGRLEGYQKTIEVIEDRIPGQMSIFDRSASKEETDPKNI